MPLSNFSPLAQGHSSPLLPHPLEHLIIFRCLSPRSSPLAPPPQLPLLVQDGGELGMELEDDEYDEYEEEDEEAFLDGGRGCQA